MTARSRAAHLRGAALDCRAELVAEAPRPRRGPAHLISRRGGRRRLHSVHVPGGDHDPCVL